MKETRTTDIRGTMNVYQVPGDGLIVKVAINAGAISIEPGNRFDENLDKGCKYTYTGKSRFMVFTPEDYKNAWREYAKQVDASSEEYQRMRKAFTFALKMYRRKYGEIFA